MFFRGKKFLVLWGLAAAAGGMLLVCGALFYWVMPLYVADPLEILREQTPVRVFCDPQGKILHVRRTWEGQWRFQVPLEEIAPITVKMILAVEDRNFYRHSGVDLSAVCRAFYQNLTSGRIVSGGSTISMQLASMSLPYGKRRSWRRKFLQVLRCRRMEMLHSKKEILQEYLNRIPMGGNLYGIESGALYYFGRNASDLNISESALLCGLPQRPNAWRPDRHLKKALRRRDLVLYILERQKVLSAGEAQKIRKEQNLRFRSFAWKPDFMLLEQTPDRMYFDRAAREVPEDRFRVVCAYRREISGAVREILKRRCRELPGVTSASAVLIENATGQVVTLIGSVEEPHVRGSQINGAFALRSAGSTLKPFIYAEAVSGGMIVEETLLADLPVRYGNYVPLNYDGTFRGEVTVREALEDSLNIPAIRLGADLGAERIRTLLRSLQVLPRDDSRGKHSGLSLILGSAGHTLFDLTNAYRVFSRDGVWNRCSLLAGESLREKKEQIFPRRIFSVGTGAVISSILSRKILPSSALKGVSWKTGTSNGNRDAWCFAWNGDWTLGIWFGNKDNRSSAVLNGVEAAAPAAGRIFSFLPAASVSGSIPESYAPVDLCRESGLRAGISCKEVFRSRRLSMVPLKRCARNEKDLSLKIRTPVPGNYSLTPGQEKISLTLECTLDGKENVQTVYWMLNGRFLGSFLRKNISLERGSYSLRVIGDDPQIRGSKVEFTVE